MELQYSAKPRNEQKAVKAMGRNFNISFKDAIVVCDNIRGRKVADAVKLLEGVIALEKAIPYRRFQSGIGHRRGMGRNAIAKYPQKAASKVLGVLKNIQANAEFKGLDSEKLKITHVQAQRSFSRTRRKPKGRYGVWVTDLVNVQVIAEESR